MVRKLLSIGDPAPRFECRSTNNKAFRFEAAAGRYVVLTFFGTAGLERNASILRAITGELRHYFDDEALSFFGVSIDPDDEKSARVAAALPGIRYFWDFSYAVSLGYGAIDPDAMTAGEKPTYHGFTLVIDPFLRVLANIPLSDAQQHNDTLATLLAALPPLDLHAGVPLHAPLLMLPRVFEPEFCRELIAQYERSGGMDSGFMRQQQGQTVGVIDYKIKRRHDFNFEADPAHEALREAVRSRLKRRLIPAMYKAFQFHADYVERYLVACYDGEQGGFFRAHRDNTTKGTAHRQFACTINLNTDEYEGGDLRFPEFGSRTYRAPTGGAAVFSCSLLHEVLPVTKGKRYAFLPFFYSAAMKPTRDENRRFIENTATASTEAQDDLA